jgi:hypothetical protein
MSSPLLIQTLGKKSRKLWNESKKIKYHSRIRVTIELYIFYGHHQITSRLDEITYLHVFQYGKFRESHDIC